LAKINPILAKTNFNPKNKDPLLAKIDPLLALIQICLYVTFLFKLNVDRLLGRIPTLACPAINLKVY